MDYTYVMPSSRTVRRYLEDANLLNLKYLADRIISNPDEAVVTLGLDDTTKAAGNKVYDVKMTHFTFKRPESSRECFTTGFRENASHAGKEAAKQVTGIFSMMATLADCTVIEIKEAIDFFMVDRAADANLMLKELGIEDEKILKCTAHICLCCGAVIDNIFRQQECESGTNKLLDVSPGTQHFCSPSTSIFTIASIALPKLLSPSHSAHSVSLFSDFTQWCADNEIELMGFKGFQANGFGRIASNAKTFLEYETAIIELFEEVVDDSDNILVAACAHYIRNRWFKICCEVYVFIAELIIFPLDLIGIDNAKKIKREDRNWIGIFHFFENKLSELSVQQGIFATMDGGKNGIISEILLELVGAIQHQLREIKFFDAISIETHPGDPSVASQVD